jgi:hypothetical protein
MLDVEDRGNDCAAASNACHSERKLRPRHCEAQEDLDEEVHGKVAAGLLPKVRREAVGQVLDVELQRLLKRLHEYPGVGGLKPSPAAQNPVLPIVFRRDDRRFSYFSLITTVGTP